MLTKRDLLRSTAAIAAGAAIARPSLLMAQSYPGIIEAKDIAEEGFIYGLPIVMNYGIMYEFAVDQELRAVQGAVQSDQERIPGLYL